MGDAKPTSEQERIRLLEAELAALRNELAQLRGLIRDLRSENHSLKSKLAVLEKHPLLLPSRLPATS